ncbi:MAG: hypothetical protein ACRDZU_16930, partial [Acidimicrobiales bacterium]
MAFSCVDLVALTAEVVDAWRAGADADWSARAGTLSWSCTHTADHAVDTVLAPAFFLASRNRDHYPAFEPSTMGPDRLVLVGELVVERPQERGLSTTGSPAPRRRIVAARDRQPAGAD